MPNIQEIIRQIQQDTACPICGEKYELSNIKVRGVFENAIIIQTVCPENHITVFMTIYNKKQEEKDPIQADEVLDLVSSLKSFNGDFESLWTR